MFVLHTPNPNLRVKLSMSVYVCLLPKTSAAFSLNITLATQRNSGEQNLLQDCCILDYQLQLHVVFGCLATGVVMVEYITPPDLALMDSSQLGSSWAHIGWGSSLVRANRGQSTNIFWFSSATRFYTSVDNHMYIWQPMTIIVVSCDTESWPWKMNYSGIR